MVRLRAPGADAVATDGVTSSKGLAPLGWWFWLWEREPGGSKQRRSHLCEERATSRRQRWIGSVGALGVGARCDRWRGGWWSPAEELALRSRCLSRRPQLLRMDGTEAGVAEANMVVMNPGGTESDDAGDAGGQSCVGASRWPSKASGADATPGSTSSRAEQQRPPNALERTATPVGPRMDKTGQ
jgi:hypothetical protein